MTELQDFLQFEYLGNTMLSWGLAAIALLVVFTVLPLVKGYISARRQRPAAQHHSTALDLATLLVARTTRLFLWAVAFWAAESLLTLPKRWSHIFGDVMIVILWLQIGVWATAVVKFFIERSRAGSGDPGHAGSLDVINFLVSLLVWTLALLLLLDNLGVNITALVAGLGVGGIAIALAVQTILSDVFGSLSITLDRPFAVGDFLVIDNEQGRVEQIGIKSTRLRSITGEQIIMSNADLLKSRVHNFGRMYERRAVFTIGVMYETPREVLQKIPALFEAAVRAQPKTRFDRSHFTRFGDSALYFETVYFVLEADYTTYANIQQAINFRIIEDFEKLDIQFAYPTQRQVVHHTTRPPPPNGNQPARGVS